MSKEGIHKWTEGTHDMCRSSYMSRTPLYRRWRDMLRRCYDPNSNRFYRYGKRGVMVADVWRVGNVKSIGYDNFVKWANNNGFDKNLQLDRIDNNKGYSPSNCRWVTAKQNSRNKSNNRKIEYNGILYKTLTEACEKLKLPVGTIEK